MSGDRSKDATREGAMRLPPDPGIWHCCGKGHIEGHDPKCGATTWRRYEPLLIFGGCIVVLAVLAIFGALTS